MDNYRPGTVEGEPAPPKNPYQKSLHYGLIMTYYGSGLWMALNMLRKSPDNTKRLDMYFAKATMRRYLMQATHFLYPAILITGLLVAGTGAGRAITTYPKVGDKWVIGKEDLDKDASLLENLYTNRKIMQFNHRTLGIIMTGVLGVQWVFLMRTKLGFAGKLGFTLLIALLYGQLHIGGSMVKNRMKLETATLHAFNAYLILSLFIYLLHTCRTPNPAVLRKIALNLKQHHSGVYQGLLKKYPKEMKKILK